MGVIGILIKSALKPFKPSYMKPLPTQEVQKRIEYMQEFVKLLPGQHDVSKRWIQQLIEHGDASSLKLIVRYLRSDAADSIGKWDRALLLHQAIEKLDLVKTLTDLMH
ncbi:hypothetical protein LLE49_23575 [Alicyclobacillus tolerans]|uniref:hypothetical protein n=1 Tax=Alicyclobacillus tolerans TaxID=90970 RepID=UPI001F1CA9DB|nr:hypothetical protein [Alicyclobacillus tolerans]MCF8567704.1 hypothetical protein [Alicyclobacillus tolerans]